MTEKPNTAGREKNEALPLGERPGLVSNKATERTGKAETCSAGPDGPDATVVGDTFKKPPAGA